MSELNIRHAQKQNSDLRPKLAAKNPNENFIPFVCHFDPNTILTKNGELLQVIRITGFNHESIASELVNLRETVRGAISSNIKNSNFALWLHTIRRKKDIASKGEFGDYFSKKLNDDWNKINNWQNQFVNELYLTIIIQGHDTSIIHGASLLRSLSMPATKKLHNKLLNTAHKSLSKTVANVLKHLDDYGAKLLGIKEWDGILYSEQMRFFGKITNLCENRFPINTNDIASDLVSYKIAFGNQSLEVVKDEKKHFATMLSIKEYREVSIKTLDKFLQIPQEFIITQSLDFIDRNKALSHFEYQNYILEVSGDEEFRYLSDLEKTIGSDKKGETDYAEQQMTVMLINQTVQGLENDIESALDQLHNLGLVTVREDIFFEHCFWSQLPGNFQFLRRQKPIMVSRVAGFASLHNFPAGSKEGNYWGDSVSIFRTILGTPYFFNFHNGDNGHTLIVGPLESGKTTLLNFLVCQSRKFNNQLYYFGHDNSDYIFINAINGNYWSLSPKLDDPRSLKINPLSLPDTKENRQFICDWFGYLINYGKNLVTENELKLIPKVVDKIFDAKIKKLSLAANMFKKQETKNIYYKLSVWYGVGKYHFIFDNEKESNLEDLVNCFSLNLIMSHKTLVVAVVSYILYKIETTLSGKKTMIVLDEAWKLIDNYAIGPKINDWLVRMRKKNCIVIFATESVKDAAKSNITEAINKNIATKIFLPNSTPSNYYKTVFGLNDNEFALLSAMSSEERHFLLKHDDNDVVASLNLDGLNDDIRILSSISQNISVMNEAISKYGCNPKDWIPNFLKSIK